MLLTNLCSICAGGSEGCDLTLALALTETQKLTFTLPLTLALTLTQTPTLTLVLTLTLTFFTYIYGFCEQGLTFGMLLMLKHIVQAEQKKKSEG